MVAVRQASDPADFGVLEAAAALRAGAVSAVELVEACLRRIDERNGGPPSPDAAGKAVNAWARVYADDALAEARAADDRRRRDGDRTPALCGIPVGVKDIFAVAGRPLAASSRVLESFVPNHDAPVVAALRSAGMPVLGHTHTHEFASGGTTDQVANPWNPDLVAGGSSGGSAAALAARMIPAALGTDTCGSLRIPSACCGTSAIKPTHGRLSIDGVVPFAASLDHPGPMARTVADAAALLSCMAEATALTPLSPPPAPLGALALQPRAGSRPLEGTRVALTSHVTSTSWDDVVADGFDRARTACEALGAQVVELPEPHRFDDDDLMAVLLPEIWHYHRRFAAVAERYRPSVAELVEAASKAVEVGAYLSAQARRAEGTTAWQGFFSDHDVDVVLEPTMPVLPPRRGHGYARRQGTGSGDSLRAFTALWDLTGMPVVSLPVTEHVGVSLAGPLGAEAAVVRIAVDLQERALPAPELAWPPAARG